MNILIANDTRVENHHGCSRVMNCIDKNISQRGQFNLKYMPLLHNWSNYENSKKLILTSDIVLINGEGTLHDNANHVDILLDIITFADVYKVPTVIINCTVFNLSKINLLKLSKSKLIYVRDKASQNYFLNSY